MKRQKTVDDFIASHPKWQEALEKLRAILISTGLEETIKWGAPCYTLEGKNIVGVGAFKAHFGLWFFQGALLTDSARVLVNAQEGKTRAMRQWRMTSAKDIKVRTIKSYIKEALENQRNGEAIKPVRAKTNLVLPPELVAAFKKNKKAASAFKTLSPGKQRDYAEHIAEAKRADTKARRLEKILPMISAGQGLHDKYRNC